VCVCVCVVALLAGRLTWVDVDEHAGASEVAAGRRRVPLEVAVEGVRGVRLQRVGVVAGAHGLDGRAVGAARAARVVDPVLEGGVHEPRLGDAPRLPLPGHRRRALLRCAGRRRRGRLVHLRRRSRHAALLRVRVRGHRVGDRWELRRRRGRVRHRPRHGGRRRGDRVREGGRHGHGRRHRRRRVRRGHGDRRRRRLGVQRRQVRVAREPVARVGRRHGDESRGHRVGHGVRGRHGHGVAHGRRRRITDRRELVVRRRSRLAELPVPPRKRHVHQNTQRPLLPPAGKLFHCRRAWNRTALDVEHDADVSAQHSGNLSGGLFDHRDDLPVRSRLRVHTNKDQRACPPDELQDLAPPALLGRTSAILAHDPQRRHRELRRDLDALRQPSVAERSLKRPQSAEKRAELPRAGGRHDDAADVEPAVGTENIADERAGGGLRSAWLVSARKRLQEEVGALLVSDHHSVAVSDH
jgi:hypothetical protein